jgi:dihydroorotate dehydrogenase (fumarate)
MANTRINYMGLELNNPVIVSSSGLTSSASKIKELADNQAGAVVLKSLFEEQINYESGRLIDESSHSEALDYIRNYSKNKSVDDYLKLIDSAKKQTGIPVIASINCISADDWTSFAKRIESAGADGLELNLFFMPLNKEVRSDQYEDTYLKLAEKIQSEIRIPIAIKLGNHFTNLVRTVHQLKIINIPAVVLFNRFYSPDININTFEFQSAEIFSTPADIRHSLRWIGIISSQLKDIDIAASTGVHDGEGVVKQLLAGATAVQVCSTLYKNGAGRLTSITEFLDKWMDKNNFKKIDDFRGKMSYKKINDPSTYERSQFMKYFSSYD